MSDTATAIETTVTAYLCASPASEAIEFYKKAFGATELYRLEDNGRIGHAEITIGGSTLFLSDDYADYNVTPASKLPGHSVSFVLSLPDVDAAWGRAIGAGAKVQRPIAEAPYGRGGWIIDPFGHVWNLMTPNPDFNPEDM